MFEKWSETDVFCTFLLQNVRFATAACNFCASDVRKAVSEWGLLCIFTSKCAFRHSGVQFFDIRTSKSAPDTSCFVHFHFQLCVSPKRRAIFRHQNFKKSSGHVMFCTFSLPNMLLATAACNFSTSELQKVLRTHHVLYILTSQCAFRHSGVQFLISLLRTYLRTRRFNRPTFRLTRHTNHSKNTAFRDFSNIWRGCIFFLLTFALLHLLSADLTTLLCFSTVHIVGSFYLNFLRTYKMAQRTQVKQKNHQTLTRSESKELNLAWVSCIVQTCQPCSTKALTCESKSMGNAKLCKVTSVAPPVTSISATGAVPAKARIPPRGPSSSRSHRLPSACGVAAGSAWSASANNSRYGKHGQIPYGFWIQIGHFPQPSQAFLFFPGCGKMLAPAALAPKEPNHATKNGPGLVKGLLQPPNARVDFRIRHD